MGTVSISLPRINMPYKHALAVQEDCLCTKYRKQAYINVSTDLNLNPE
jgi:hypothetical protein